jgi:hypothetical protein
MDYGAKDDVLLGFDSQNAFGPRYVCSVLTTFRILKCSFSFPPGFWTRLVGPFKEPVDPVQDGVPDYFDKVKKPMDLGTIRAKMERGEYPNEQEFVIDMNQIFTNCYLYWDKKDPMWAACEKLQKTFEERFSGMSKWLSKMAGPEKDSG